MNTETYKFWKEIIYPNGKLDVKQVLRELDDYYFMLEEVPKVYDAVSNGMLSKPNYHAITIIGCLEDNYYDKQITQDDVSEMLNDSHTLDELKNSLIEYFNLGQEAK
jgi:hypothetical protein